MATLRAVLRTDGASAYLATIDKVTAKNRAAEASVRSLEGATGMLGSKSTSHMNVALRGSSAFAGKLSVINKTAFAAGESTAAAGAKMSHGLSEAGRAARGAAAAFGGLGALGPLVEAMVSPVGLAAAAIGGLVFAIKKLRDEMAELDKMDTAGAIAEMARAAAGQDAAAQALLAGIAAGKGGAELDALVGQAEKMGEMQFEIEAASKAVSGFREEQKALIEAMRPSQDALAKWQAKLDKLREAGVTWGSEVFTVTSRIEGLTATLAPQQSKLESLKRQIDATWGSIKVEANATAIAASVAAKHTEAENRRAAALKKSADEAARLAEKLSDLRAEARSALGGIGLSLATPTSRTRTPSQENDERLRGTAAGMVSMFGDVADALEGAVERFRKVSPPTATLPQMVASGVGGPIGGIIQGASMGGIKGAIAAMVMQSDVFAKVSATLNEHVQRIIDTLGAVFEPFIPIVRDVVDVFKPMLEAARPLVALYHAMNPAIVILAAAMRNLAIVTRSVTTGITKAVLGFLIAFRNLLKKLPGGGSWKALDDAISGLRKSMDDTADAASKAAEALGAILPEGYKLLELRRFNADPGIQNPYGGTGGSGGGSDLPTSMYPSIDAPPGYHWAWVNGAWRLVENGGTSSSTGSSATSGSSGNGATSTPSLAGATIILQGVQSESELWTKLRRMGQREATVRTGRASYVSGAT